MKCNICGRQSQNEEANFCEYCGSSFREHVHTALNSVPREQINGEAGRYQETMTMQLSGGVIGQSTAKPMESNKPVSLLNWLGTYGLLFIPIVGGLLFIIQLFIWSFSSKTPESKKNWARATLIFVGISIVILIFLIVFWSITVISSPMYQEMMNGTFDYNSYYNGLYNLK